MDLPIYNSVKEASTGPFLLRCLKDQKPAINKEWKFIYFLKKLNGNIEIKSVVLSGDPNETLPNLLEIESSRY